jgi:hypothetical protein
MAYSDKVLDHYENPRNVGSFDKNDPDVATGMVGAPACGDVMKLTDQSIRWHYYRCKIQNIWLRLGHCQFVIGY